MNTATSSYEALGAEEFLETEGLGLDLEPTEDYAPPSFQPSLPPAGGPVLAHPGHDAPPPPRSRVLPRLLAMADTYLRAGSLRQALEMYFDLIRSHPDAPEASEAEDRILEVARRHEEAGELHSARAIYQQLA